MFGAREVEVAAGAVLIAIGLPLLFLPRVMFWYLDREVRPLFEMQERMGLKGWTAQYRWQRELLRYLGPVVLVLLGIGFLVDALVA